MGLWLKGLPFSLAFASLPFPLSFFTPCSPFFLILSVSSFLFLQVARHPMAVTEYQCSRGVELRARLTRTCSLSREPQTGHRVAARVGHGTDPGRQCGRGKVDYQWSVGLRRTVAWSYYPPGNVHTALREKEKKRRRE